MDHISLITSGFIGLGAVIMAFNFKRFHDVIGILKNISNAEYHHLKRFLFIHKILIISFLIGYVIVLYAVSSTNVTIGNLFVGVIFFSGAVFVLLGIVLQRRMITSIGAIYEESLDANRKLIINQHHTISILNSLPSIIMGLDSQGRCTMWNHMAEKFAMTPHQSAVGTHFVELIPDLSSIDACIMEVVKGQKKEFEKKLTLKKNGLEKLFMVSVFSLKTDDTQGAVVRLDDITEKMLMENEIVQTEKMMSVGGLAAGMAHEINNPLAGMMQNAQVIHNRLTKQLPSNDAAALELGTSMKTITDFMEKRGILKQLVNINEAGKRAAKIIENMLNFVRKSDSIRYENHLSEIMDRSIDLAQNDYNLKTKYDFKQIQIIKDFDADVPAIRCEANKIQQVFFNIIKNASEAMIHLETGASHPTLTFRIQKKDPFVSIEIEDNGPGMDEDVRKRIFEPFFTTKGVGRGTGLGLSVSYFIVVEDHGGEIEVESTVGTGTRFIIRLPY